MQLLCGFHKLLLVLVPNALEERESVKPANDEHDVVLRVGPPRHSGKIKLVSGGGKARRLTVSIGGVGVCGKVHRGLRM